MNEIPTKYDDRAKLLYRNKYENLNTTATLTFPSAINFVSGNVQVTYEV